MAVTTGHHSALRAWILRFAALVAITVTLVLAAIGPAVAQDQGVGTMSETVSDFCNTIADPLASVIGGPVIGGFVGDIGCGGAAAIADPSGTAERATKAVFSGALGDMAQSSADGGLELMQRALTWWTMTSTANPIDADRYSSIVTLSNSLTVLVAGIAIAGVIGTAISLFLQRRMAPVVELGTGIFKYIVTTGCGLLAVGILVAVADELSTTITTDSINRFNEQMKGSMLGEWAGSQPMLTTILGLVLLIVAALMWLASIAREAGLLVLLALMPLAAAGQFASLTREWLAKWATPLIALIFWKPMAAFIYSVGFEFTGNGSEGDDLKLVVVGLMVLVLSVVALPMLMGLFSFAGTKISGGSSVSALAAGGGALMGSAAGGAMSNFMSASGPGSKSENTGSSSNSSSLTPPGSGDQEGESGGNLAEGGGSDLDGEVAAVAGGDSGSEGGAQTGDEQNASQSGDAGAAASKVSDGASEGAEEGAKAGGGVGAAVGAAAGAAKGAADAGMDEMAAPFEEASASMGASPEGGGSGSGDAPFPTSASPQSGPDSSTPTTDPSGSTSTTPDSTPTPPQGSSSGDQSAASSPASPRQGSDPVSSGVDSTIPSASPGGGTNTSPGGGPSGSTQSGSSSSPASNVGGGGSGAGGAAI
ncbi:hypothetical protein [Rhodococcus sp. BH5]|uniref:hypothetical protein n=1 Tax=Rhodococcus sp. BH5 TaxID=2871702 RepID=UPI0022CD8F46|nr:hypothetical protein [Rhodococcus sp. BH5]MCZ9635044.1 hypothetical protein [Rhodococcus sp. BH5]